MPGGEKMTAELRAMIAREIDAYNAEDNAVGRVVTSDRIAEIERLVPQRRVEQPELLRELVRAFCDDCIMRDQGERMRRECELAGIACYEVEFAAADVADEWDLAVANWLGERRSQIELERLSRQLLDLGQS